MRAHSASFLRETIIDGASEVFQLHSDEWASPGLRAEFLSYLPEDAPGFSIVHETSRGSLGVPQKSTRSQQSNPRGAEDLHHRAPTFEYSHQDQWHCSRRSFASSMCPVTVAQHASLERINGSLGCHSRALRRTVSILLNISRVPHGVGKQDPRRRILWFGFHKICGNCDSHLPILCC